jgi:alginate O-acetyltransferase complex protein AlgI
MLVGGLWHGAGWTFVLWGAYHGALLAGNDLWRRHGLWSPPSLLARMLTFAAVAWGWVLFRAASVADAASMYAALAGRRGIEEQPLVAVGGVAGVVLLAGLLLCVWGAPNLWKIRVRLTALHGAAAAAVLLVCLLRFDLASPFLYFQF